ncbi:unnamed protein product [Polarella glacialis]|uniref:Uncharacterized protein n=1 Tax=Polarella glacialis TaxID=89957 RepID=A0A813KAA3_POLGL|nr:unnamed protein product [Polarella glacialis]
MSSEACAAVPGPGRCIAKVVDSSNDTSLESFFAEVFNETHGRLDILVNNAYSAIAYWRKEELLGKPFWEQPMQLFDEVFQVGVRSHYKAATLAVPMMQKRKKGLIVNTNSLGCVLYAANVPYGMGKCAIDKMTGDMAMELATENIDIVSWWAGVPMQTDEILAGSLDGTSPRRGALPGIHWLLPTFQQLYSTALATTLLFEGRSLAALARDGQRARYSGMALLSAQVGRYYGIRDERGLCPPSFMSVKYLLTLLTPLFRLAMFQDPSVAEPTLTSVQDFYFNVLPNIDLPQWLFKLTGGPPLTFQWPVAELRFCSHEEMITIALNIINAGRGWQFASTRSLCMIASRSDQHFLSAVTFRCDDWRDSSLYIEATAAAFEAVLRFIYSAGSAGEAAFQQADPLEVLHLSVEFLLEDLTRLCEWKLMQGLTLENSLATFGTVVSVRSKVPVLAEACVERLQGRMKDVVGTSEFQELCRSEVAVRELLLSFDEPNAKRRRCGP